MSRRILPRTTLRTLGAVALTFLLFGCNDSSPTGGAKRTGFKVAGDAQVALVGTRLPVAPVIEILSSAGNPVADVGVVFTLGSGGGSIAGPTSVRTGPNGQAALEGWTLGETVGAQSLVAEYLGGSQTFTAVALPLSATALTAIAGDAQTVTVGEVAPVAPRVRVTSAPPAPVAGEGVANVPVRFVWTVTADSSVVADVLTDSLGNASFPVEWRMRQQPGATSVRASIVGGSQAAVSFGATAVVGAPAQLTVVAGDAQEATVGAPVAIAPQVRVADRFGNVLSNVTVTFSVVSGGGQVTGATATSNASGLATIGSWTLGTGSGAQVLRASVGSVTADFTATANGSTPASLQLTAGDAQRATVNTAVAVRPRAEVRDGFGNVLPSIEVTFVVNGTEQAVTTNAQGVATYPADWVLARTIGTNLAIARVGALADTITATGVADVPASMEWMAGTAQSGTVATAVAVAPSVRVRDQYDNLVANALVRFTPRSGSVSGDTVRTDAQGIATLGGWTLGTLAGTQRLVVTTGTLADSTTATAAAGAIASIRALDSATVSDTAGRVHAVSGFVVRDAYGNPVSGATVTFTVDAGTLSVASRTTDANGQVEAPSWTLGGTMGMQRLTATAGSATAALQVRAVAGLPTRFTDLLGDGQRATVGTAVTTTPRVRVTDANGNATPVPVQVAFTFILRPSGSTTMRVTTDANGYATLPAEWTLATLAGENTLTVSATGIPTATITAIGVADVAATLTVLAGDAQQAEAGTAVAVAPRVRVQDQYGNLVIDRDVTFTPSTGGAMVGDATVRTDSLGVATAGGWTLAALAGAQTLQVRADAQTVTMHATAMAAAASAVAFETPTGITPVVGQAAGFAPTVRVTDRFGNVVNGSAITFSARQGAIVGSAIGVSGVDGIASLDGIWTFATLAGAQEIIASVNGASDTLRIAVGVDVPAVVTVVSGNAQSAVAGTAIDTAPVLRVTDQYGNVVANAPVTFSVTLGDGSLARTSDLTDAAGLVSLPAWTLGSTMGGNAVRIASGAGTATVTATATADAPYAMAVTMGAAQTAKVGTAVAVTPRVRVTDRYGNVVGNATVRFTSDGPVGGALDLGTATTAADGLASLGTAWTMRNIVGMNTLLATSGAASVTFQAAAYADTATAAQSVATLGDTLLAVDASTTLYTVQLRDQYGNIARGGAIAPSAILGRFAAPVCTDTDGDDVNDRCTTVYTASATIGIDTVRVAVGGSEIVSAQARIRIRSGAAARLTIVAGDAQTATAGTAVSTAPTALVVDANGNPVPGESVTFSVATGGGSVTSATATTGDDGRATVGGWTLGTASGTQTLRAVSGALEATVTATATAAAAAQMSIVAGDGQTGSAGGALALAPKVRVRDAFGNAVVGATVSFSTAAGNGTVANATATTNALGEAEAGTWTLGGIVGTQRVVASLGQLEATFSATAGVGAAAEFRDITGDGQTALVGTKVLTKPRVRVTDAFGNGVRGVLVTFTFNLRPSGSVEVQATSDSTGVATLPADWRLSTIAGANTVTVTSDGLSNSPTIITAFGLAGLVDTMTVAAGDGQSAAAGSVVATAPQVLVKDQYGNPAAGRTVRWSIALGGGSVAMDSTVADTAGRASVAWTLGTTAGTNRLTATANGKQVTIDATATAAGADTLILVAGGAQQANEATALTDSIVLRVTDQYGNKAVGTVVGFTVSNGGSVAVTTDTADADGLVSSGIWTLGAGDGTQRLTAAVSGGPSTVVTATALRGGVSTMSLWGGDEQYQVGNTAVLTPPSVRILDADSLPIAGVAVTFTLTAGGGTITGENATTNAQGIAAVGSWTLGASGTQTLVASSTGFADITFTAHVNTVPMNVTSAEKLPNGTQQFSVTGGTPGVTYTWSVNGVVGGNSTYGTISTSGYYVAPNTVPDPATFPVCATSDVDPEQVGCVNVTISDRPSAGGELIVMNDINWGDLGLAKTGSSYQYPGTVKTVQNFVNFAPTGVRGSATKIWFFNEGGNYGASHMPSTGFVEVANVILAAGYTVEEKHQHSDLTSIPSDVKVIWLMMPGTTFAKAEYNALKTFASEGGRIIYVGENGGYYSYGLQLQVNFLSTMGAVMTNTGGCEAPGVIVTPFPHQVTTGVGSTSANGFYMNCVSRLNLGANDYAIFKDQLGQVMVGAAKIDYALIP